MRKKTGILLLIVILAGTCWMGYRGYQVWRQNRLVHQARVFLDRGEFRSAVLSARQALVYKPSDVRACEVMAGVAEKARSPEGVFWRGRIAELQPSFEHSLA